MFDICAYRSLLFVARNDVRYSAIISSSMARAFHGRVPSSDLTIKFIIIFVFSTKVHFSIFKFSLSSVDSEKK